MQEEQDQHREEEDEEMDTKKEEKREGEELARGIKDAKKIRVDMVLNEALNQEDDDPRGGELALRHEDGEGARRADGCSCTEGGGRVHEADQALRQGRLGGVHPHDW